VAFAAVAAVGAAAVDATAGKFASI
jgi:hypothetical protein